MQLLGVNPSLYLLQNRFPSLVPPYLLQNWYTLSGRPSLSERL